MEHLQLPTLLLILVDAIPDFKNLSVSLCYTGHLSLFKLSAHFLRNSTFLQHRDSFFVLVCFIVCLVSFVLLFVQVSLMQSVVTVLLIESSVIRLVSLNIEMQAPPG